MTKIQIKRGIEANRTAITPDVGEPIYATDSKKLYVGDGSTAGGVEVATIGLLAGLDGGSASTVYLASQSADGGGAATTYTTSQLINGGTA